MTNVGDMMVHYSLFVTVFMVLFVDDNVYYIVYTCEVISCSLTISSQSSSNYLHEVLPNIFEMME